MTLRYEDIADIVRIIDSSQCDELVVETADLKLIVRRRGAGALPAAAAVASPATVSSADVPPTVATRSTAVAANGSDLASSLRVEAAGGHIGIRAPMVGTFYSAPAPDQPPFVAIGSTVAEGDPLCLIEVMKLFTTILATHAGRIVQIGARNGELVEYGSTLFVIEPQAAEVVR